MRRAAKVDSTQEAIVKMLRSCGMSVQPLHTIGKGCPDILVGWAGGNYGPVNVLLELKDGSLAPSARKLTKDESEWHSKWSGQVAVVGSPDEAVSAVLKAAGTK